MHVGGGVASALPEVDDFDGLFAVIVRGKESEERVFLARFHDLPRLPMTKLALFRATLTLSLSS